MMYTPDRELLKDKQGRALRKALVLELSYNNPKYAIYTLKDEDYEYKGKLYYSLKKIFLECADPTEYKFATNCFANWKAWKLLAAQSVKFNVSREWTDLVDEWREELEIMLRSQGLQDIIGRAGTEKGYQAEKYLADKGWVEQRKGRPSKQDIDNEIQQNVKVRNEVQDDLSRLLQ